MENVADDCQASGRKPNYGRRKFEIGGQEVSVGLDPRESSRDEMIDENVCFCSKRQLRCHPSFSSCQRLGGLYALFLEAPSRRPSRLQYPIADWQPTGAGVRGIRNPDVEIGGYRGAVE